MEKVQSGMRLGLLFLDLPYGNGDGLHIVRWLRRLRPGLPIGMAGHPGVGDEELAFERTPSNSEGTVRIAAALQKTG
jgi:hypothetical protein